ncbi:MULTISPECIES: tetratricopeptide repeat protein [Hyphobacterium]|uniref:Tetratricopeptide repeat protein n=1 Tax=Hyphobacterium vulgare TaxID=1736751 RepID=A0ABV6ZZR4_9PROT
MLRALMALGVTLVTATLIVAWLEFTREPDVEVVDFVPPTEEEKEADAFEGPVFFADERLARATRCTVHDMSMSDGFSDEWWVRFNAMEGDDALIRQVEAEAEAGSVEAMEQIAFHLASRGGDGTEDAARAWMVRAADAGSVSAINEIGYSYTHGTLGHERDVEAGVGWLMRAMEAGDPLAASNLASLYAEGEIAPPAGMDAQAASLEAHLVSAAGCYPPSLEVISDRLKRGRGVPRDLDAAGWIDRNLRIYRN